MCGSEWNIKSDAFVMIIGWRVQLRVDYANDMHQCIANIHASTQDLPFCFGSLSVCVWDALLGANTAMGADTADGCVGHCGWVRFATCQVLGWTALLVLGCRTVKLLLLETRNGLINLLETVVRTRRDKRDADERTRRNWNGFGKIYLVFLGRYNTTIKAHMCEISSIFDTILSGQIHHYLVVN